MVGFSHCLVAVSALGHVGDCPTFSLQEIHERQAPGANPSLQGLLLRPPLCQSTQTFSPSERLVAKLCGLVSLKGEDVLLQGSSEVPVRYHRLRSSLPAKLWRWRCKGNRSMSVVSMWLIA